MSLTTKQAHKLTGYREWWLRDLARRGWLKVYKEGREWRFDEPVLRAYQPGEWISIAEASSRLDYSPRELKSLVTQKRIRAVEVSGFWLLNWPDLLTYHHQGMAEEN